MRIPFYSTTLLGSYLPLHIFPRMQNAPKFAQTTRRRGGMPVGCRWACKKLLTARPPTYPGMAQRSSLFIAFQGHSCRLTGQNFTHGKVWRRDRVLSESLRPYRVRRVSVSISWVQCQIPAQGASEPPRKIETHQATGSCLFPLW
jgi:hypothetical protein